MLNLKFNSNDVIHRKFSKNDSKRCSGDNLVSDQLIN